MMDELVDTVLERLYAEDAAQRAVNLPSSQRTRNVDRETGREVFGEGRKPSKWSVEAVYLDDLDEARRLSAQARGEQVSDG